ncbi:MAG TPA: FAD-binding protein [Acidimicrobiales bacterium]|jgi:3-oxosteroid 1-dehydrogenase|nr:FAD-binding protein [Acidimicrobiales bacterium]
MAENTHRLSLGERVAELAGVAHRPGAPPSPMAHRSVPPEECDVLVAGSGAAALSAAAGALSGGGRVVVCEKGPVHGGTTACSGGVAHVYANSVMRAAGIEDPRDHALGYMARVGYPGAYDPDAPCLGLQPADYTLLETYYDRGAEVMGRLADIGAVHMEAPWSAWDGQMFPDYYEFAENRAVRGRGIQPVAPGGGAGNGGELIRQLMDFASQRATEVRLEHRVVDLVLEGGEVTGAVVDDGTSRRTIRCHGGVVFGSGGFAHSPELRQRFLRGPIAGGSGVPSNTGDLVDMGTRAGAQFGAMHNGWWNQQVLEAVDDYANSVLDVWAVPGDSMVLVNRFGVRAIDEKREYESRGRVHHVFAGDEYVNRVMFMVYDERTAQRFGGRYPIPPAGAIADHVTTGVGVAGLTEALGDRLRHRTNAAMPAGIAPVSLAPGFAETLTSTISRFNSMAEKGHDDEFGRGSKAVEFAFHGPAAPDNGLPNALMYPIDAGGPLHAVSLVGTTFDTDSGPRVDSHGRILGTSAPINGLYGAGNCVDGVFGEGYPGGGSTIGPGMVFGFLAGVHAANRSPRTRRRR